MNILKSSILAVVLLVTTHTFSQTREITFDTYANVSASKASKYLLADNVALRDCPATQCQKLTTLPIGLKVRLLEKSDNIITVNGVSSRFYRVKVGPDSGWIWGGLIAQKTLVSKSDPTVLFVFGEKGVKHSADSDTLKHYQIRAVKHGKEIDRLTLSNRELNFENVINLGNKGLENIDDIIGLTERSGDSCDVTLDTLYVVWKNNTFKKTNVLAEVSDRFIDVDHTYMAEN
ncbi:SH3 domain-containing protein [Bizionia paragorgiae]|uniref:SH3 domain-containing protein n=1 Tax=Bizionia paragorgiae TaxID=283786 RepID=UPI00299E38E6|nr:SH3 domain-containing protein [Bizionia paragorgiae]MDX1270225.1 SH3 domain-containing protein [Bizionia paragorgiae]